MSGMKEKLKNTVKKIPVLYFMFRCVRKIKRIAVYCCLVCADLMRKRDKYCIICGHKVGKFMSGGIDEGVFTAHHIIGGGLRDNCTCIYCGHNDRERWQYYILKKYSGLLEVGKCSVLHFAAEKSNSDLIRRNRNCRYITADIEPGRCDVSADMTNLNMFDDNTFDFIIANHVLEHILDEAKAISELKRILKDNGKIILSFPLCTDMKTYEDSSITTPEGRLKAFGQTDHVRLYGTDYKERLESYGLEVKVYSPQNELTDEEITRYGFIRDDVSIFCTMKH